MVLLRREMVLMVRLVAVDVDVVDVVVGKIKNMTSKVVR